MERETISNYADEPIPLAKACACCKEIKPIEAFCRYQQGRYGRNPRCRDCVAAKGKARRIRVKLAAFEAYGGPVCAECGKTGSEHLCIDPIEKERSQTSPRLYARLKREGWPEGYRVLCFNCRYLKVMPTVRSQNPDQKRYRAQRAAVLEAYGAQCAVCGEEDERLLCVGQVEGARKYRRGGSAGYRWLRDNDFPAGFVVLCRNCIGKSKRDK